jgi:hypothetical protein
MVALFTFRMVMAAILEVQNVVFDSKMAAITTARNVLDSCRLMLLHLLPSTIFFLLSF